MSDRLAEMRSVILRELADRLPGHGFTPVRDGDGEKLVLPRPATEEVQYGVWFNSHETDLIAKVPGDSGEFEHLVACIEDHSGPDVPALVAGLMRELDPLLTLPSRVRRRLRLWAATYACAVRRDSAWEPLGGTSVVPRIRLWPWSAARRTVHYESPRLAP